MIFPFFDNLFRHDKPFILCLAGPTASGKSDLAIQLALKHNAIIINADSCQIYKNIPVITASPTQRDKQQIPHFLYNFLDLESSYDVHLWCLSVMDLVKKQMEQGKNVIIVGGTGLYFHTLRYGIAQIPDIDPIIRQEVRDFDNQKMLDLLKIHDPERAEKLHLGDTQRLQRATEVFLSTGKSLSFWQTQHQTYGIEKFNTHYVALIPENRETLYHRINMRFEKMMGQGALEEAQFLYEQGLSNLPIVQKVVGLKQLMQYFNAEISLAEAVILSQQASRQYAKRQMTWFRNKGEFTLLQI
jgi:tRNA dimethylallyltransferase